MQWEGHHHPVSVGKHEVLRAWERRLAVLSEGKYLVSNLMGCHRSRFGLRLDNRRVGEQQKRKRGV